MLKYSFEERGLNRVSAGHFAGNDASGRVQQKCGLRCEGTLRQEICKGGRFYDTLMYAILCEDYFIP